MKHFQTKKRPSNAEIVEQLFASANRLFDSRVALRRDHDVLQQAYDDASGIYVKDMYADPDVRETRDTIESLEHSIGQVARQMEYLARLLKRR